MTETRAPYGPPPDPTDLQARLAQHLADVGTLVAAQAEIINRLRASNQRQAEAIAWLFEMLTYAADRKEARRLFPDVVGEVGE